MNLGCTNFLSLMSVTRCLELFLFRIIMHVFTLVIDKSTPKQSDIKFRKNLLFSLDDEIKPPIYLLQYIHDTCGVLLMPFVLSC